MAQNIAVTANGTGSMAPGPDQGRDPGPDQCGSGGLSRRGGLRLALGLAAAGLLLGAHPAAADGFSDWLRGLRADAQAEGISPRTLDAAFAGVQPIPKVIELDRKQPESVLTFQEYL